MYSIEKNGEHETAVGNAAAMREALVGISALIADEPDGTPMIGAMKATIDAALSEPARNCDVGTPHEQDRRRIAYCRCHSCKICPLCDSEHGGVSCDITWAQMPYEAQEGVKK